MKLRWYTFSKRFRWNLTLWALTGFENYIEHLATGKLYGYLLRV